MTIGMTISPTRAVTALAMLLVGCSSADRGSPGGGTITGAGATFPNPIYAKWFDTYARQTGIRINYQPIGSGGGIRQFTEGTVDFGATDGPMTDGQIAAVKGNVMHVPTVLGAVVVTYNLPALGPTPLRFDGDIVAGIFLGQISRWNDRRIAALNPGRRASPPGHPRRPPLGWIGDDVHLHGLPVESVAGLEARGRQRHLRRMARRARRQGQRRGDAAGQAVGGRHRLRRADLRPVQHLPAALLRNASGKFVAASIKRVTAAAASADLDAATDFRVSITNAPGAESYPISSFSWLLVHREGGDSAKEARIRGFLRWMLEPEAQRMAAGLEYAPLPVPLIERLQHLLPGP